MNWLKFCELNKITKSYQNCKVSDLKKIKNRAGTDFFATAERFLFNPYPLLLQGDPGTGKTYFMLCLIKELIESHNDNFRFMNAIELEDRIIEQTRLVGTSKALIESLSDIDFLFLDDFGVEMTKQRAEKVYYSILDYRLSEGKGTVISTNLNNDEIITIFGTRINSRLNQCLSIHFDGLDLRKPFR